VVLARGRHVGTEDLPEKIRDYRQGPSRATGVETNELVALDEIERRYILRVLTAVQGNKSRAAQVLGLDRKTLYRRLERYEAAAEGEPPAA
jgi:two-component system response regulator HydG